MMPMATSVLVCVSQTILHNNKMLINLKGVALKFRKEVFRRKDKRIILADGS
jgi:hypothetical protein